MLPKKLLIFSITFTNELDLKIDITEALDKN